MRGDILNGFTVLAGDFPPSLNTASDPTKLQLHESPAVWGASADSDGLLMAGKIPTAQPNTVTTYTFPPVVVPPNPLTKTYQWFYNRLWRASGAILYYGAPNYTDAFIRQGLGEIPVDQTIVQFQPALGADMWITTAAGSYFVRAGNRTQQEREPERWIKDFYASTAANCLVLGNIPYVSNDRGVFSFDGQTLKELTRPVRYALGPFANVALGADYTRGYVIGPAMCIDTQTGKLFDFSQAGFSFMSRTLTQDPKTGAKMGPFTVERIAFLVEHQDTSDGFIQWQTSIEDNDFVPQEDAACLYEQGLISRVDVAINSDVRTGHKFRVQLTGMSANIGIRSIEVMVRNLAVGSISE